MRQKLQNLFVRKIPEVIRLYREIYKKKNNYEENRYITLTEADGKYVLLFLSDGY